MILIVAANSRAKVVDRDGFEKLECAKGDPYIVDMASTKVQNGSKNYHFAEMRKWRFYFKLMLCHNYACVLKYSIFSLNIF